MVKIINFQNLNRNSFNELLDKFTNCIFKNTNKIIACKFPFKQYLCKYTHSLIIYVN